MLDFTTEPQKSAPQEVQIAPAERQHIADLLRFCKGWQKFAPFVGACLLESLQDEEAPAALRARIVAELREDGATLQEIAFQADPNGAINLKIDAYYA